MKKLTLSIDSLNVESFLTERAPAGMGTVRGHDQTEYTNCYVTVCVSCDQCDTVYDCPATGDETCGETACTCSGMPETCGGSECFSYYTDCHRC